MTAIWNPRAILAIDPTHEHTCVGTNLKDARCGASVKADERAKASRIIDRIALRNPRTVQADLLELAEWTLCKRSHRSCQQDKISQKWWDIIVHQFPEPAATPPSESASQCHTHSRRKPLVDPCPVCTEEICCVDDAVWCRDQCGQNVHRACFAPWRSNCMARDKPVTCVYCRAHWKWEWEE